MILFVTECMQVRNHKYCDAQTLLEVSLHAQNILKTHESLLEKHQHNHEHMVFR